MPNTKELNLFFPLNDLDPMGWLNDFITPQIMEDKESIAYSMFYRDYDTITNAETKNKIKSFLTTAESKDGEKFLFNNFLSANTRKFVNEKDFIFINGKYSDILENNISSRKLSLGPESDMKKYVLFMNNIKPHQMAFFQPYVRLYYGWKDDPKNKKEKFKFIEFPFSQYFELDKILENNNSFLEGSGIQNVSIDTQFTIGTKRNCRISIDYFFGNMNVLTRKLDAPDGENPKYGFSFMKTFSNMGIKKEVLQLEYGYYVDPTLEDQHGIPSEICSLINRREVRKFGILKTSHRFSFNKEGGIKISVDYVNLAEAYLNSDNNVMIPTAESLANVNTLNRRIAKRSKGALELITNYKNQKLQLEKTKEKIEDTLQAQVSEPREVDRNRSSLEDGLRRKRNQIDQLKLEEAKLNKTINSLKRSIIPFFKNLFLEIIKSNYDLYSITFNTKKSKQNYSFNTELNLISPNTGKEIKIADLSSKEYPIQEFYADNTIPQNVNENLENILNRIFNTPRNSENSNSRENHILFFPLRALIRAAYQTLRDSDTGETETIPSFIFGNLTCRVFDKTFNINVGNILIEVTAFQKWMHNKFIKNGIIDISFGRFINEIMDDLVPDAVYRNKTYPQATTRITIPDYNPTFYIKNSFFDSPIKSFVEHVADDSLMFLMSEYIYNSYEAPDTKPLIIYSKLNISTHKETTANNYSVSSNKQLRLNEIEDASRGIPYLYIGSDGGMFMDADFNQIDLKGLRTAIALQSLTDDNSSYFYYKYTISANVFASSIFNHGSIICVPTPPFGLVGSDYDLGIVGYYKVKGLRETIDAGGRYRSNITADWFWDGGTAGKRGALLTSDTTQGKTVAEIYDYVPAEAYDPKEYVKLLIESDINTLVNFGLKENKKAKKKDTNAKTQKAPNKPKDAKEKEGKKDASPKSGASSAQCKDDEPCN